MRATPEHSTKAYWEDRVKRGLERGDLKGMIFEDGRFDKYTTKVNEVLSGWKDRTVLDIACGYGRYAHNFSPDKYTGWDFSEEMVKLAKEKFPEYDCQVMDINKAKLRQKYDVIFEVNSLKSLNMSKEQFIEKFSPHAKHAIAVLEADYFEIIPIY